MVRLIPRFSQRMFVKDRSRRMVDIEIKSEYYFPLTARNPCVPSAKAACWWMELRTYKYGAYQERFAKKVG